VFVYGSLRTGAGGPMQAWLAAAARSIGDARVRGRLFVVDWYPGLVLGGETWVRGELWVLDDPAILLPLDAYEGCGPDDRLPHEFVRTRVSVHPERGDAVEAWVYAYAGPTQSLAVIASGDWLEDASRRRC
jgi:gamma-glutamylcyclotransferase (GGCT)/AIG2-like uncharacterized protein YtfP